MGNGLLNVTIKYLNEAHLSELEQCFLSRLIIVPVFKTTTLQCLHWLTFLQICLMQCLHKFFQLIITAL